MYQLLCADDEAVVREALTLFTERLGLTIRCVVDGATCLEAIRLAADDYDLVIVNYEMPGMNGIQVLRELRQIAPAQRLALSTAYPERDVLGDLPPGELVGFLRKPYTLADFRRFLRTSLPGVEPCLLVPKGCEELGTRLAELSGDRYRVQVLESAADLLSAARGSFANVVCLESTESLSGEIAILNREDIPALLFEPDNGTSAYPEQLLSKFLTRVELTAAVDSALR